MFHNLSVRQRLLVAFGVLSLLLLPVVVRNPYILHLFILSMLFGTFATAWNIVTGYAGVKTFGHHAFFGIGAYASALLAKDFGVSPWITMWVAGLLATAAGFVIALPVLRIRSLGHIAIVTLSFAEIIRMVCTNLPQYTRGEIGLFGIPFFNGFTMPIIGTVEFNAALKIPYYYLIAVLLLATLGATRLILNSKIGLAIVAMRESQDAAESLGINLTYFKLLLFGISAFIVGVTGAFYAHYVLVLTPTAAMGVDIMILIIAMVVVGGMGTQLGPIIGAFILTLGIESMRFVGEYRMLIYGAFIIITMMFVPGGLIKLWDIPGSKLENMLNPKKVETNAR